MSDKKLWGGHFAKPTDKLVHEFNESISFDQALYQQDIRGSIAWARGLVEAGILEEAEAQTILAGLEHIRGEFDNDTFWVQAHDEDIHSAVERRLIELVGDVGRKLHTGRSRNDQVATDFRLWVMGACAHIDQWLAELQQAMIDHAEQHLHVPMPGYTHLQHAQPVTWGHWLLSHFWPLVRDRKRFERVLHDTSELPLGSGALAGTAFPVNRHLLAEELGFESLSHNSMDAVSNRDFVADFLYASAMVGLHLGRLSEQLIIFASQEFGFVLLDDGYSTGSSLMPQKKNPDTLELTRGKSGRLLGKLMGFLATLKGLPSTYDKDLQEDKEPVFDAFATLQQIVPVMAGLISTLTIRPERMAEQLEPNLLATDLADYLVKAGVSFRQAHELVGEVVQLAETKGVTLVDLTLAELQGISDVFGEDVTAVFNITTSLAQRNVQGGTSPEALHTQLTKAKTYL